MPFRAVLFRYVSNFFSIRVGCNLVVRLLEFLGQGTSLVRKQMDENQQIIERLCRHLRTVNSQLQRRFPASRSLQKDLWRAEPQIPHGLVLGETPSPK